MNKIINLRHRFYRSYKFTIYLMVVHCDQLLIKKRKISNLFNPSVPSVLNIGRLAKILI